MHAVSLKTSGALITWIKCSNLFLLSRALCSSKKTFPNKKWGTVPLLRQLPPLGFKLKTESIGKRSSVNIPLAISKMLNYDKLCRTFQILTPERMTVSQASGQAYRAPPILAAV